MPIIGYLLPLLLAVVLQAEVLARDSRRNVLYPSLDVLTNSTTEVCEGKKCEAYPCYEGSANCGSSSYLVAFAWKYCHRFQDSDVYKRFDDDGKVFINCTSKCLLNEISDYFKIHTKSIDCTDLANTAFASHSRCYLDCGFCRVCKHNKMALYHAYDLGDFLSIRALRQIIAVIGECGLFECFSG